MRYGIKNEIGRQPTEEESLSIIHHAVELGISCFDTAGGYGDAESILGKAKIQEHVVSKLTPGCADNAESTMKAIQVSLVHLGKERIYGYMFHRMEDMEKKSLMSGMMKAKEMGLVEKIGVSVYSPQDALHAVRGGKIDIIQIPYNALDRRWDEAGFFSEAKQKNIEIYARSPFLQGILLMDLDAVYHVNKTFPPYIARFQEISHRYGYSPAEAAFLFSYSHPDIDYLVFGVDCLRQLQENFRMISKAVTFDECYRALFSELHAVPENLLNPSMWQRGNS